MTKKKISITLFLMLAPLAAMSVAPKVAEACVVCVSGFPYYHCMTQDPDGSTTCTLLDGGLACQESGHCIGAPPGGD